jgi:ABC-type enterochelin transport system substrate-binding protein
MTRLAAILACLLTVALAACGGDDAPTREEFADRANEICRKAERSAERLGESAQSREEIAEAVDRVIEESRDAVDELDDLEVPEGEAGDTAERFVDATRTQIVDEGIPVLEDLRDAVEQNDAQAAQEASDRLEAIETEESDRAARELGANACAGD